MREKTNWQPIHGEGVPEGLEVDEGSGDVRINKPDLPDDGGTADDREPRNPKVPPTAGEAALQVPVDENV